jgi:hypothetical protein
MVLLSPYTYLADRLYFRPNVLFSQAFFSGVVYQSYDLHNRHTNLECNEGRLNKQKGYWLAIVVICLPLFASFWGAGVPITIDGEAHLHRMVAMSVNLENGYFWGRWSPMIHAGFGYPTFNYYSPLFYIMGGFLVNMSHENPLDILKILMAIGLFGHGFGAFALAKTFTRPFIALLATIVYLYAPMRLFELGIQWNAPQWWALGVGVWLLWAIRQYIAINQFRYLVAIALLWASVILLHHISAFLLTPVVLLGVLACYPRGRVVLNMCLALVWGVGIATMLWLPIFAERDLIQLTTIQDSTFQLEQNFLTLDSVLATSEPIDRRLFNWRQASSTVAPRIGQLQAIIAIFGILTVFTRQLLWQRRILGVSSGLMVLVCIFLTTSASGGLWQAIPISNYIQFPWRVLNVALIALLPCTIVVLEAIFAFLQGRWTKRGGSVLVCILAIVNILPMLFLPSERLILDDVKPSDALTYEAQTGNMGLTPSNDYLPIWAQVRPQFGLDDQRKANFDRREWWIDVNSGALPTGVSVARISQMGTRDNRYQVQATQDFTLTFLQLYFPSFAVVSDGRDYVPYPIGENGLMAVDLPSGTYDVWLVWRGTFIQQLSEIISLLLLLASVIVIITFYARHTNAVNPATVETVINEDIKVAPFVMLIFGMLLIVNSLNLNILTSWLQPNSNLPIVPAQHGIQALFGESIQLLGYDLSTSQAQIGDTIHLRLYWQATQIPNMSVSGAVQLASLDYSTAWASVDHLNLGEINVLNWRTDTYVIDEYTLTIPPETTIGEVGIDVVLYEQGNPNNRLRLSDGNDFLRLMRLQVR